MSRRRRSAARGAATTAATWRVTGLVVGAGLARAGSAWAASPEVSPVWAYIDPGAGSFILQAIVASLAGAAVAVSAYWRRIKRFFGIESEPDSDRETNPPHDD